MASGKDRKGRRSSEDVVWAPKAALPVDREFVGRVSEDLSIYGDDQEALRNSASASGTSPKVKLNLDAQVAGSSNKRHQKSQRSYDSKDSNRGSGVPGEKRSGGTQQRYTGGGDRPSILMDWYNTAGWTRHMGFDLELWWSRSGMTHRLNAGIVALTLAIFLMNLAFGLWLIWVAFTQKPTPNPYICQTKNCHKAALWMSSTMNTKVDPCENFYEFVCGNYRKEKGKQGDRFDELIKAPSFAIEFGENSILAKILKNYRNDKTSDLAIKYYQACLDLEKRKKIEMTAFLDLVEEVFGTRDFSTFESTTLSLETIGHRMFEVVGHASFINMAFFTYPYIQILHPRNFVKNLHQNKTTEDGTSWMNGLFIEKVFSGLLPHLNVPDGCPLFQEMTNGVHQMTHLVHKIYQVFHLDQFNQTLEAFKSNPGVQTKFQQEFLNKGLCPPMGVNLNMAQVLSLFVEEPDYRLDFIDLMAVKYFGVLSHCFSQPSSSFIPVGGPITNPKTGFVALWLLELFWEYHLTMDSQAILESWGISRDHFESNEIVTDRYISTDIIDGDAEFPCLIALYRHLGYVPTIHYLLSITDNPAEFIGNIEDEVGRIFNKISGIFDQIPTSEIAQVAAHLSQIQFDRGFYIDVGMPLVSGLLDKTSVADYLPFNEDHLNNSIIATRYTVEKGRQNWLGSTNSFPTIRWWGSGGPSEMRSELLDLREPMHIPAPFVETNQPGEGKGKWAKFLGRGYPNYLLYPLSLIGEPHVSETMALHYAGFVQKILRSLLSVLQHQFFDNRYPSLNFTHYYWVGSPETDDGGDRRCSILFNEIPRPPKEYLYTYTMFHNYTMFDFTWWSDSNFFALLALKWSLRCFQEQWSTELKMPFSWAMTERQRSMRMWRHLPDVLSGYSQEQLYFIDYVRHTCRGSWKTHNDTYKEDRWLLETEVLTVLMQMEEFAKVWNCPKNSFMANEGQDRCTNWVPENVT